jgi:hypothetical protein
MTVMGFGAHGPIPFALRVGSDVAQSRRAAVSKKPLRGRRNTEMSRNKK